MKVSSGREREEEKERCFKMWLSNIGVVTATGKATSRPQDWVLKPLDFQDHPLFFSDHLISNNNTSLSTYSPKRHCLCSSFPFSCFFYSQGLYFRVVVLIILSYLQILKNIFYIYLFWRMAIKCIDSLLEVFLSGDCSTFWGLFLSN